MKLELKIDGDNVTGKVLKDAPLNPNKGGFSANAFADYCEKEALKNLVWTGVGCEIDYVIERFRPPFSRKRYAWCAMWVHAMLNEFDGKSGIKLPIRLAGWSKFKTFALVANFLRWAVKEGFYIDNAKGVEPKKGDIILFDWDQRDIDDYTMYGVDHIGVFLRHEDGKYIVAEGNNGNKTTVEARNATRFEGWIRIPEGYMYK